MFMYYVNHGKWNSPEFAVTHHFETFVSGYIVWNTSPQTHFAAKNIELLQN